MKKKGKKIPSNKPNILAVQKRSPIPYELM